MRKNGEIEEDYLPQPKRQFIKIENEYLGMTPPSADKEFRDLEESKG